MQALPYRQERFERAQRDAVLLQAGDRIELQLSTGVERQQVVVERRAAVGLDAALRRLQAPQAHRDELHAGARRERRDVDQALVTSVKARHPAGQHAGIDLVCDRREQRHAHVAQRLADERLENDQVSMAGAGQDEVFHRRRGNLAVAKRRRESGRSGPREYGIDPALRQRVRMVLGRIEVGQRAGAAEREAELRGAGLVCSSTSALPQAIPANSCGCGAPSAIST